MEEDKLEENIKILDDGIDDKKKNTLIRFYGGHELFSN
jgi:hypothetical protein